MAKNKTKNNAEPQADKPKSKASGRILKFLIIFLVVVVVALIGLELMSQQTINQIVPDRQETKYLEDRINILVVGTDADENGSGRADSIMVFNVDLVNDHVNVLSIPRDSRVDIPGRKYPTKINHSFAYGGIDLTKETVSQLLGVPIDYYAVTNFAGFEQIVEILDGVYIDVPRRMKTHTWYGDIDLQPGYQLLDAQQALGFVRYRYDAGGDIARAERQQLFLKAVYERVLSMDTATKLPQLVEQIFDMVDTDLTTVQLMALVNHFKDVDLDNGFVNETVAGHSQTLDASYWIIDEEAMQEAVQRLFYDEPADEPVDADGADADNADDNAGEDGEQTKKR